MVCSKLAFLSQCFIFGWMNGKTRKSTQTRHCCTTSVWKEFDCEQSTDYYVFDGESGDSLLDCPIFGFSALNGADDSMIFMDKGFFSAKNLKKLFAEEGTKPPYRFLFQVPFTNNFAQSQVESERKDIDSPGNVILTSATPIRGIHKLAKLE